VANIEITGVDLLTSWAPGATQSVDVHVDNHETVGPVGWGPVVCDSDGIVNDGHKVEVTLRIRDSTTGTVVWEATKSECIPVERPSTSFGPNATLSFAPSVTESGSYTVRANLQVLGNNGGDQSDTYPLQVEQGGATAPPDGDERGAGLLPGVDAPGGVLDDPIGAAVDNPALAFGAVLLGLIVLRPYASLGASATG
jgi:hypothetical protein